MFRILTTLSLFGLIVFGHGLLGPPAICAKTTSSLFDFPLTDPEKSEGFIQLNEKLRATPAVRGTFKQEKKIPNLERPLTSRGTFVFSQDQGIYWRIEDPHPSEIIINKSGLFKRRPDRSLEPLAAGAPPGMEHFSSIFIEVFSGRTDRLKSHFDLFFVEHPSTPSQSASWELGLKPRKGPAKRLLDHIILRGGEAVEGFEIGEKNSGSMSVRFSNLQKTPNHLSDEEAQYFSP